MCDSRRLRAHKTLSISKLKLLVIVLIKYSRIEMLETLSDAGFELTTSDDVGYTMLHYAALCNCVDFAARLIDLGNPADHRAPNGITPLILAVDQHAVRIAKLLLQHGADPEQTNQNGESVFTLIERRGLSKFIP